MLTLIAMFFLGFFFASCCWACAFPPESTINAIAEKATIKDLNFIYTDFFIVLHVDKNEQK